MAINMAGWDSQNLKPYPPLAQVGWSKLPICRSSLQSPKIVVELFFYKLIF